MITILNLFVCYSFVAIFYSASNQNSADIRWRFIWLAISIYIFLLSSTRVGGSDWENYEFLYLYMSHAESLWEAIRNNSLFEPGYVGLNYIFYLFTDDRRALIVFESIINSYAIWLILTRARGGPLLMVWLFPLQFASILGVRQTLATSVFMIFVLLLKGRASVVAALSSGLIHLSSLLLFAGFFLRRYRLTWKSVAISLLIVSGLAILFGDFFFEKLSSYLENPADKTAFGGIEIFLGKGLTIFLLISIEMFARQQPRRYENSDEKLDASQWPLYVLYLAMFVVSIALPSLSRILTPLELLISWTVCKTILEIQDRFTRVCLTIIIILIALAKMLKIYFQLSDMYAVCFFCAQG